MIETIEISPHIIAHELAKFLYQNQYLYTEHDQAAIHTDELRNLIYDFLTSGKSNLSSS